MAQVIFVPELDQEFEFPDEASDDQIKRFLKKQIDTTVTNDVKPSVLSKEAEASEGKINEFQQKLRQDPQGEKIFQQIEALKAGKAETKRFSKLPEERQKEILGNLVSSTQVGLAFSPLGGLATGLPLAGRAALKATPTLVETAGTYTKSILKGESQEEARGKALKAGGVSAILDLSLFGSGKLLASGAAKKFNSAVVEKVKQNPAILRTKKDIDDVAEKAFNSLKKLRKRKGELVGKAKDIATKENKLVDIFPVSTFSNNQKRAAKLIVKKGQAEAKDPLGREAFDVIDTELVSREVPNFENVQTKIDNIDDSKAFKSIYEKLADETKQLTKGEKAALKVRGELVDTLNKSVENVLEREGLKEAKKEFSVIARGLKDPLIKRGTRTEDAMATFLAGVTKKKKRAGFKLLSELEGMTPPKDRFIDDLIGAEVNEGLGNISEVFSVKTPRKVLEAGAKVITRQPVTGLLRRGAVELTTEPEESLETVQQETRPIVEPVSRSLNEILFGPR